MSECDICEDNRFELIAKYRAKLIDSTNIEDRPEEMAVIDNILFRCWQMGWLDQLEKPDNENDSMPLPRDADDIPIHVGDWITGMWNAKAKVVAVTSDNVYWWEPDGCHWCHASEVWHCHKPKGPDNDELRVTIDKLIDENAKLRDLIRYMWYADYTGHFSTLPNHQEHKATVWHRIHELGIVE